MAANHLKAVLGNTIFGRYWLPQKHYVLDFAAGQRIAAYIRQIPKGDEYYTRSPNRTVLSELAALLRQRFQGEFDKCLSSGNRTRFDEIVMAAGKSACTKGRCKSLSSLQMSLHQ